MQPITLFAQPFNFTIYREADGLPSGYIEQAFEDTRGYLWLCTFGGLSRFDGRNFKNYDIKDGLAGNFCDYVCEDKKGNLWICTRKGLSSFNGKNFTNYKYPIGLEGAYLAEGYVTANNQFNCLINGKNAYVNNGKITLTNELDSYNNFGENKQINKILENGVKIIKATKGLFILKPDNSIEKIEFGDTYLTGIYKHPKEINAFYFANKNGVFHWQNGNTKMINTLSQSAKRVNSLFVDAQKRIWIGCENEGVWLINQNKVSLIKDELPGTLVPSIFQDKNGIIWISTFRGLVKVTEKNAVHFTKKDGIVNDDIRSSGILIDSTVRMQTSIFTKGDLSKAAKSISQLDTNFFKDYITSMQLDYQKRWWVFAGNSIYVNNKNKTLDLTKQIGNSTSYNTLYIAKDSTIWFGKYNEIRIVKNDTLYKKIQQLSNGVKLNNIISFFKDVKENLWIAEKEKLLLLNKNGFVDFTSKLGLPVKTLAQVSCSNQQGFWVRTQGFGAIHFSYSGNNFVKDKTINTDNGLPNNFIHDIEIDNKGNIWIATLNGLYSAKENGVSNSYNIKEITKADGIDVPNWNLAYLEYDNLNNIWLGVANGVFKINTNQLNETYKSPNIYIEKVDVLNTGNIKTHLLNNFQQEYEKVKFTSSQNDIAFYFNGVNTLDKFIEYSYILKGKDKEWITHQKGDKAVYYNLLPNKYTFMVKAINSAGTESNIASYSFTIVPPFYQTWWFRFLLGLGTILIIFGLIKRRDKQLEKENAIALQMSELKLTALQSQMNPHFIFNSLNSIQNYIMQQKPVEAARYLSKFSKLMRRILDQSFKNLTPLHEIIETLKMYMELEAFRFSNEFSWEVKVDDIDNLHDVKLPPLLLQPYVENAIIHGLMPKEGSKNLLIHLYVNNNQLYCTIDDNGIGRGNKLGNNEEHTSRGQKLTADMLVTMKQLLHTEATIKITDKKDANNNAAGTKVDLIIPLK